MKMASRYVFCFVLLIFAVTGCAGTKLVSSWKQDGFSGPALKKVLVLAVTNDDLYRRLYEDSFVETLRENGVEAVASYTLLAVLDGSKDQNRQRVLHAVSQVSADGVLVASLVAVERDEKYVETPPIYIPQRGGAYGMHDYYGRTYEMINQPGYSIESTSVKLKATVFSTQSDGMLWAADTHSFNPTSARTVIQENIAIVSAAMKKDGLL